MPRTEVFFYEEAPGNVPALAWLRKLRNRDKAAYAKCVARIQRLAELGHELRRPESDFLRGGIHELRARRGRVNYRILYFFHGRTVAFLAHAFTKEGDVPDVEIDRAVQRRRKLEGNPPAHTYAEVIRHVQDTGRRRNP